MIPTCKHAQNKEQQKIKVENIGDSKASSSYQTYNIIYMAYILRY
jgi:hypothetical protein